MKKLILIKHSMPILDSTIASSKWILSEEGKEKSEKLAEHLRKYKFNKIFCSTETKAIETASIAGEVLSKEVKSKQGVQEHERATNRKIYPKPEFYEKMKQFFQYPEKLIFGEETAEAARQRFINAVHKLIEEAPNDEDIIIVTHGTVMTLFASYYNDVDEFELWESLGLPSVLEFWIDEGFSLAKAYA